MNRSEEHTSELQSQSNLVCRLLLEKKNLRLEKLRHVLALAERRRMARGPAMLEICLVVGHAEHPAQGVTPGPAALCRPLPPFAVVSLPSHIPSPHTAPRARRPSCDATRQATIPGATSRSRP